MTTIKQARTATVRGRRSATPPRPRDGAASHAATSPPNPSSPLHLIIEPPKASVDSIKMSYGEYRPPSGAPVVQLQVADRRPYQYNVNSSTTSTTTAADTHGPARLHTDSLFDVGIFKDTLAPSLALHSGMAVVAWAAGRYTDRVDAKDWLWPSGQVVNAWWSSIGRRVFVDGVPFVRALAILSWPERLILTVVTLWGGRLFYRIASRSVARGKDDPRYEAEKKEEGFWAKALVGKFLPEALFQTVVSLPFVAPFRHQGAVMSGYHPYVQAFAVGLFSAGFGLGVLADYQLEQHEQKGSAAGVLREGVWSIVRNPR